MEPEDKQDIDFVIETLESIENDTNCIPEFMMDRIKTSIIILKFHFGESKIKHPTKVYYSIGGFKTMQVEFDSALTDEEIVEYFESRYPDNNVTWRR